ncbi:FAD-binding protein [Pseudaminobacter arsenicus]|uniref:FAD-binding protein n=1 Tax=Borborobacter arsenicus TaxID=1851146 RepID=A0A432V151_9HYPH|nr:NAD(P)/FAD-dependent oxidoreductase [Pseudaminobacter arsenicus]RUM95818.1 FAD-binding protein [Pseudaminobacter arsenicus]
MNGGSVDLAVIGVGPAGMSAAITARKHGLSVAIFDEQNSPGGQIYRNITGLGSDRLASILGEDYLAGRPLADAFADSGAIYRAGTTVWRIGEGGVSWISAADSGETAALHVLVATGAMERPFPVKGWTLPGVMTAGAAQILLKTDQTVVDDAVFVGCGPLLYLLAYQYLQAGVRIRALIDTTDKSSHIAALPSLPAALLKPSYLRKGMKMLSAIRRSETPIHRGVTEVDFSGTDRLQAVRWRDRVGEHSIECDHAFVHHGVIPNVNVTMATRCTHRWDEAQTCWRPETDAFGRTSLDWLTVAGDGGGIGGAKSAALSGEIAALGIAYDLGRIDRSAFDRASGRLLSKRRRDLAVRPFLDRLYRPAPRFRAPVDDEVVVCRCEEVRREQLAKAVQEGCPGPNQLKSFTRAGMGPCQGRMCGHTVVETIAQLSGRSPQDVGYYRIRMPIKPVTVGEIAGLTASQGEPS